MRTIVTNLLVEKIHGEDVISIDMETIDVAGLDLHVEVSGDVDLDTLKAQLQRLINAL